MVECIRYCKTDNAENEIPDQDFRSEIEIEPCAVSGRQQGLDLLISLQRTPELRGLSLQVKAPLGESTIWRPLQEVRVIPADRVLNIKAVKGEACDIHLICAKAVHQVSSVPLQDSNLVGQILLLFC